MDVITRRETPGKSLPAELVVGGGHGLRRIWQNSDVMQHGGLGDDASETAAIIAQSANSMIPILAATTPGVYYTQSPTGQITVSSQQPVQYPVGTILPNGATVTAGGGVVSAGISSGTLMMVALVGLVAFMAVRR